MRRPLTAFLLSYTPACLSIACILMTSGQADANAAQGKRGLVAAQRPAAEVRLSDTGGPLDAAQTATALPRAKKTNSDVSFIYACGYNKRAIAKHLILPRPAPVIEASADATPARLYDRSSPIIITVAANDSSTREECSVSTLASIASPTDGRAAIAIDGTPSAKTDNLVAQIETNPVPASTEPVVVDEPVDAPAVDTEEDTTDDQTPVDEELVAAIDDMAAVVGADPASIAVETASPEADTPTDAAVIDAASSAAEPVLAKDELSVTADNSAQADINPDLTISLLETSPAPAVPVVMNRSVEMFIKYFQTRGRKHFVKWLARSPAYMPMLQGILRENGLPEDIFYIALIESGLNPKAKSHAKAVGMWQFIKGTGKKFGLRIDWWIDERMDPEKATLAAAKYFQNLYDEFDSWYLAAAGYNAGEGRVRSAVRKHRTNDFWQLATHKRPLRRETREYVPKYLAAMLIAKDPQGYGFDTNELEAFTGNVYDKVNIPDATDLHVIADAAGTTAEELQRLNPELLRWYTPPSYPSYMIKIPLGSKDRFVENFAKIPPRDRLVYHSHTIKRGDTLSMIAKRYGTDIKAIVKLNNLKSVKRLKVGETIAIPVPPELAERRKIRAAQTKGDRA